MKVLILLKRKLLKNLGLKIKALREAKGLTQEQLAEKAGIDSSYVGGIEIGQRSPSLYCLYSIASALGVELKVLLDFKLD